MRRAAAAIDARLLPKGWTDLARQILLFCGAYYLYRIVRGQVDGRAAAAFDNARDRMNLERGLGIFPEPAVNAWATAHPLVGDAAGWLYVNSHFTITTVTLAFLYLRRNDGFYFVRNMFMIAMGLALVLYVLFPTAPPRFMPEWGFVDTVEQLTGVRSGASSVDLLYNPFAAVPSMHVAFALMLGGALQATARRAWVRALWALYPVLVTFVVVATANHWWLDAAFGAVVAAVAALGARALAARRPHAWALRPVTG
jgi:hypothetical protein